MLSVSLILIIVVVASALIFDFINGFHDSANAISTAVSTRALTPKVAVMMAALMNLLGAMYSTGVAKTIGGDIADSKLISPEIILAAMIGAIFWNLFTWYYGIPSSSSHALLGGIIGAVLVSSGPAALKMDGILKIFKSLIFSPLLAMVLGYIVMIVFFWTFGKWSPWKINNRFKKLQIMSAAMIAFSNGSNDAQKGMGIITLALVSGGFLSAMDVPFWVKVAASLAMASGTAIGGYRIIKTMSGKIFKLDALSGFAADVNSSIIIFGATLLHLPVSTTHVVSCSIMGVGAAKRFNAVRWGTARKIFSAWFLTIPCSMAVGALSYGFVRLIAWII